MTTEPKPDTWMPIVIGDYLKDTQRLTTEQHGAYLLLLMDYWVNGPPADDDEDLASITRLDAKTWKKHRPKLERFFKLADGRWRNKRADEELADASERKRKNTERASAGGRAKAAKRSASSSAQSSASSTDQAAQNGPENLLKSCSPSIPTEVDAPTGQSTLCGRESVEARRGGASPLRVIEGGHDDSERGWLLLAAQARQDKLRFRVSDPGHSSECAELECYANAEAVARRRTAA
ncbi:DUF1376 domain-containing protein [Phenylobacterium sp.]|uniref:YdaU family protein n=1 Tax=Phenylobacterium sp. TaxID=1871053 RepID=UPI002731FA7F|nr:DUF1376 domain-containing protein [Phenylobacterium sp.]MDP1598998.1 DUF1376 domain-containing protein [Phenylobacterium sp.]MDP3590426.1 DUF1376 domain-containing protein [Phenylobacterium sp.]